MRVRFPFGFLRLDTGPRRKTKRLPCVSGWARARVDPKPKLWNVGDIGKKGFKYMIQFYFARIWSKAKRKHVFSMQDCSGHVQQGLIVH